MRVRKTLILFAIAVVLVGYYWLVERPRQAAEMATQTLWLSTLQPETVERVTIVRPDATLDFALVDTHWEMTAPVVDLADQSAVMRILAAIAGAEVERDLGPQDDLDPFGLTDPIVITAQSPAQETVLRLGGYTVDRSFVYASLGDGEDVLLAPTAIHRYASAAVEEFRNKRVINFDVDVVEEFRVLSRLVETPEWVVWRRADTSRWFTILGADTIVGSTPKVEGLLRRLRGLRVRRFPDPAEVSRIREPFVGLVKIRRQTDPSREHSLTLSSAGAAIYATTEPDVGAPRTVEVDSSALQVFMPNVDDLREKRLLRFDRDRVSRVELATEDTLATIVRVALAWAHPNPALGDLDQRRVEAALGAAYSLEFDRVRSERGAAGDIGGQATFRLAVFADGGTIVDELLCRTVPGDSVAVATSLSSGLVAEIDVSKLMVLEDRFRRIRKP